MALEGYAPVKFEVDLRRDVLANITFQGVRGKAKATPQAK
jgi:hypothetical protein